MRILIALVVAAACARTAAASGGTIEVESTDATTHDKALFDAIARELERGHDLWSTSPPRGVKTYRLKTWKGGGVRFLTETDSTVDHAVACKLLHYRMWRVKMRSTAPRTVTVTFRFKPKRSRRGRAS